jgi:hypothetical protein
VEMKSDDLDQKRELSTFGDTVEIKSETDFYRPICTRESENSLLLEIQWRSKATIWIKSEN